MKQENAIKALKLLVSSACEKPHAQRINALLDLGSGRGHKKFLGMLSHEFTVRDGHATHFALGSDAPGGPCFIFSEPGGFAFGEPSPSFVEAIDRLGFTTSWLLVSASGHIGIYQPDDFVDDRILIQALK